MPVETAMFEINYSSKLCTNRVLLLRSCLDLSAAIAF